MSLKIDRIQLEIAIGNDKARLRLRELQESINSNVREMNALKKAGKENTLEYINLEQNTKRYRIEQDKLIEGLGMTALSMRELNQRSKELRAILSNLDPNTAEFKTYAAQLDKVNARMKDLRKSTQAAESSLSRLAEAFNKYESLGATFTAMLVGIGFALNQFIDGISEMSDVMAEVSKTTDMTIEEVKALKSEFKSFNTRTASKELLGYAYQAGKLGMKGAEEIKGFVQEADIAAVAFGKALGSTAEDTINTLGKVIGAFQIDDKLGWAQGMRHVGALINELGKQSTAGELEIVNYMSRLASVGVSLKIPVSQLAAIGATLDSLKVPAEQGSTAVQQFLFTLASESDKLSKFIGVSKKEYEAMVEKDIMKTLDVVLRTAKAGNSGLFKMIQQLDNMSVSGVRMTNTVAQLINNVDELDRQMGIAAVAYAEGTSTLNEFNISNENFAARMAKVRKVVGEVIFGLGNKLQPVIIAAAEGFAKFLKWIERNAQALITLGKVITIATVAIVSYNAAIKLSELWTKRAAVATTLHTLATKASALATKIATAAGWLYSAAISLLTGNIRGATFAMQVFNTTMKANPVGLILSLLATATAAYFAFREEVEATTDAHQELKDRFTEEEAQMRMLFETAKRAKENSTERAHAIQQLNTQYKQYLPSLLSEKSSLDQINAAQEQSIKLLAARLKWEIRRADIKKSLEAEILIEKRLADIQPQYAEAQKNFDQLGTAQFTGDETQESLIIRRQYVLVKAAYDIANIELAKAQAVTKALFKDLGETPVEAVVPVTPKLKTGNGTKAAVYSLRDDIQATINEVLESDPDFDIKLPIEWDDEDLMPDIETNYLVEQYQKTWQGRMDMLQVQYQSELIGYAEFLDKKAELEREKEEAATKQRNAMLSLYFDSATKLVGAYNDYQSAAMEKELQRAGDNEAQKDEIRRKYAKRRQTADIIAATISQAKGLVKIWEEWSWNPAVAWALTGIDLVATGAQIAFMKTQQFAAGRYTVRGATDQNTYTNVPYIGTAATGIVARPALVAERGSEAIIDHRTLYSQARDHMGLTPLDHFRAIVAIRQANHVPQYATGRYTTTPNPDNGPTAAATTDQQTQLYATMLAYMQRVDTWQQTLTVRNDPRDTIEAYDKYKATQNRATS